MNIDLTFHAAELLVLLGVAWKVISALNRFTGILRDYPPHRHINGKIIFPDGYTPTKAEHI